MSEAPSGRFRQLDCGGMYCCAIARDRSLSCWGIEPEETKNKQALEEGQVTEAPEDGRYLEVAAGILHTCAITEESRSMTCWGVEGEKPSKYGFECLYDLIRPANRVRMEGELDTRPRVGI